MGPGGSRWGPVGSGGPGGMFIDTAHGGPCGSRAIRAARAVFKHDSSFRDLVIFQVSSLVYLAVLWIGG